jgi:hypothetical protein
MRKTIEIQGKSIEISTTSEADAILSSRKIPLVVEMELLFDFLVSKKVRFLTPDSSQSPSVSVSEKLSTRFRPVMMQCKESNHNCQCCIADFPIVKLTPYVPKWLRIDFRFGHWFGEFGY